MTEKMNKRHVNSSIFQGYCPSCGQRSLKYPRNLEYGGLMCYNEKCSWKNIYYIGPRPKKKGSSSDQNKPKPNNAVIIDMTSRPRKRYRTGICYTCPDHPNGKPIDPSDTYARKTENGWICGTCRVLENTKMLSLFDRGNPIE